MTIYKDGVEQKGKDLVNILREIAAANDGHLIQDEHDCVNYLMVISDPASLIDNEWYGKCYDCGTTEKYLSCKEYVPCMNKMRE